MPVGYGSGGYKLAEGWINLHLLLWKFVISSLTRVETEDAKFEIHEVWRATWFRLERKALAKLVGVKTTLLRAESRGNEPPDIALRGLCLAPLAKFTETGELKWDDDIVQRIKKLGETPKKK